MKLTPFSPTDKISKADSDAATNGCSNSNGSCNSNASTLEATKTLSGDGPRLNLREEPEVNAPTLTSNGPTNSFQEDLELSTIVESYHTDLDKQHQLLR